MHHFQPAPGAPFTRQASYRHQLRMRAVCGALSDRGVKIDPFLIAGHLWERLGRKVHWTGGRRNSRSRCADIVGVLPKPGHLAALADRQQKHRGF